MRNICDNFFHDTVLLVPKNLIRSSNRVLLHHLCFFVRRNSSSLQNVILQNPIKLLHRIKFRFSQTSTLWGSFTKIAAALKMLLISITGDI